MKQQYICSRPFEWFEVHPDGSTFLCCPAWLKRPLGNLLRQQVDAIWNGPVAREIRKSIFNGSFHNCSHKRCPHLALRTSPVDLPAAIADPLPRQAIAAQESQLNYLPRQLNLCFDLSCTLACPSCRKAPVLARGAALQRAEQLCQIILRDLLPTARSVILSGFGDPFGSPTYLKFLRQLQKRHLPELKQLRLHSNGQLLTKQLWLSFSDLQPLISDIEISIDAGSAPTYALNRPGGDFTRLLRNLKFLSTTAVKLTLSMVVQRNNWREIPQLLELADSLNARIYLSQLLNWGTFSQEEYRQRAVQLPDHPEHELFKESLFKMAGKKRVSLGNLNYLSTANQNPNCPARGISC